MDTDDDLGTATVTRSVQVLTAVSMLTDNLIRVRQQRAAQEADRHFNTARQLRTAHRADQGAALATYGVAADPGWRDRAGVVAAAEVWSAAHAWAGTRPDAATAQVLAEDVLRKHNPVAMSQYDGLRRRGVDEQTAMAQSAPMFISQPLTVSELAAARGEADAERAQANRDRATPDLKATPADEATMATHTAGRREGWADAAEGRADAARPVTIAGTAYPTPAAAGGRWVRQSNSPMPAAAPRADTAAARRTR